MKLPSSAERTCFNILEVPALKIATVASAIGLPPSSRTIPLIIPRLPTAEEAGGVGALAKPTCAVTSVMQISKAVLNVRLKPIAFERFRNKNSELAKARPVVTRRLLYRNRVRSRQLLYFPGKNSMCQALTTTLVGLFDASCLTKFAPPLELTSGFLAQMETWLSG